MLNAPLAPFIFPATDRPSARFVARLERALRTVPDDVLGSPMSMQLSGCAEEQFATCVASMAATSRYIVVSVGGLHGLIGIPDAMLHALVEYGYGGDGSELAPATSAPTRLAARFGYRIATMFSAAIAPALSGADVAVIGATDDPAEAVAMDALALACGFEVSACGISVGGIGLCLPMLALARLENAAGGAPPDEAWSTRLEDAVAQTRLKVRCVLARPTLSAGGVARLVPGLVIPIPSLNEVALIAGGYRVATGIADARNGRAAIVINRTEFQS